MNLEFFKAYLSLIYLLMYYCEWLNFPSFDFYINVENKMWFCNLKKIFLNDFEDKGNELWYLNLNNVPLMRNTLSDINFINVSNSLWFLLSL